MNSSQIRAQARESLNGQWGKAILVILVDFIITLVISFCLAIIPIIGTIIEYIIAIPLSVGITAIFMKITRREEFGYFDFINIAIELFGKAWGVVGHTLLKMWKPILLLIISIVLSSVSLTMSISSSIISGETSIVGPIISIISMILYVVSIVYMVVKGLLYSLSNYILIDNQDMSTKDIVEKSETLMIGNRVKFVCLGLSFIGWALLATILFFVGYLWLVPYMTVSQVIFYMMLAENVSEPEGKVEEISEIQE